MDTESNGHGLLPPTERVWRQFLAVLEQLPADARAVLLLHDAFGIGLAETGAILGLTAPACRQHLQNARRCVRSHVPHLELPSS